MDFKVITEIIAKLGALKYFPADMDARLAITEAASEIVNNEDEARWLVRRMLAVYGEWPGLLEMRALFCTKFKPADGIEASLGTKSPAYGAVYPDIDARSGNLISATPQRQISGDIEPVSNSPSIAATLSDLVRSKDMKRTLAHLPPLTVREIPVIKLTDANRVTAADVQRAVQALRDQQAKEAAGIEETVLNTTNVNAS